MASVPKELYLVGPSKPPQAVVEQKAFPFMGFTKKNLKEVDRETIQPKKKVMLLYDEEGLNMVLATLKVFKGKITSFFMEINQVGLPTNTDDPILQQLKTTCHRRQMDRRSTDRSAKHGELNVLSQSGLGSGQEVDIANSSSSLFMAEEANLSTPLIGQ